MKVVFFSLEFPPVNTTGNYRSAGFVRHLLAQGVDIIVITCTEESGQRTFGKVADNSLMKGLEQARIYRYDIKPFPYIMNTKLGERLRIWLSFTDNIDRRWFTGSAKKDIMMLLEQEKPDFIFTSLPPFSLSRVALYVHKHTQIPFIVDMRDAWALWSNTPHTTYIHYLYKKFMEKKLFINATFILAVTKELTLDFISSNMDINSAKFKTVFNGYDNLFSDDIPLDEFEDEIYRIGYVGSFYYMPKEERYLNKKFYQKKITKFFNFYKREEYWIYRSPYFFLKTIRMYLDKFPEKKDFVRFEYIGKLPEWLPDMVSEFDLNDVFVHHGFKDKASVLKIMSSWNAILTTSEKVVGGDHYSLPSKLFDAVNSGKRILAFITEGAQNSFLKKHTQSVFFPIDDVDACTDMLEKAIDEGDSYTSSPLDSFYTRKTQSKILYKILYGQEN